MCVYVLVYFFRLNNWLKNNLSLLNILWLALLFWGGSGVSGGGGGGGRGGGRLNDTVDGWSSRSFFSNKWIFFIRYVPSFVFLLRLRNSSSTSSCVFPERGLYMSWDNTVDDFFNIDIGGGGGGGG